MLILLGILLWLAMGFVDACIMYAYFQRKYPEFADKHRNEDSITYLLMGLAGPLALISSILFFASGRKFHGFLIPFTKDKKNV